MPIDLGKDPFIFDGAFGTYYSQISGRNRFCEYANLNEPHTVIKIHRQYINAGARAIKTNTFGANSTLTEDLNELSSIITRGYALAVEAAQNQALVFADIGYIDSVKENIAEEYVKIAQTFLNCGAQYFLFETLAEYEVIKPAIEHIKERLPEAFILVSFAVLQDGFTKKGYYYKDLINEAIKNPEVDAVGLNCICGPSHLYQLIKELDLKGITFSAMPNAGYPATINGRTVYEDNARYFSLKLADIFSLGVKILGGCCGTTPEHIKAAVDKVARTHKNSLNLDPEDSKDRPVFSHFNSFKNKLLSGRKIIAVEINPPLDNNCDYLLSAARKAADCGADIITLADSPLARARADSIMMAAKIKRELNIDVLPHLCCRDRNHIAIKAALLGASIEGLDNILIITGDPITQTDRRGSKGVFSYNSFNLISYIQNLNKEVFTQAPFFIGAALNVNAAQFEHELKRAQRKIENGAGFLLSQPIFSDQAVRNLSLAKNRLNCRILAGILPVASYKNALFLNNEVSGIHIPEEVLNEFKDKAPSEAAEISIRYSLSIIDKIWPCCDGFYFSTPLQRIDLVCRLIEAVKSKFQL